MLDHIQKWLADHAALVDAMKWVFIILLGWLTGFFRYLFRRFKRANVSIVALLSKAYQIEVTGPNGVKGQRTAFMIDVGVENPTSERAVLRVLTLSYRKSHPFRRFTREFGCVTYPAPIQITIGEIVKIMPIFFSTFPGEISSPTKNGELDPKGYQQGYILIVAESFGSFSPKVMKKGVKVKLHGYFTDGRTHSNSAYIPLIRSFEELEKCVPGISNYLENPGTRNIFV